METFEILKTLRDKHGLTQEELGVHTHCLETIAANAKNMLEEKNRT